MAVWAPNGRKLADSGEAYAKRHDCVAAIENLITEATVGVTIVG